VIHADDLEFKNLAIMKHFIAALSLAAAAVAAPAAPQLRPRQVGGGLGGFVPGASGFLSGTVPASGLPFGCIGGVIDGEGATICARGPMRTPAPQPIEARQVGGGLGGFVPSASGFLSGTVPASGIPFGCIGGGILGPDGVTICARAAAPTPAPVVERQVGGGLGGFVPSASGFLSGTVPASGIPFGCIGGGILGPDGVTICARAAEPTPAPVVERQIGGGLGGFVPGASGTATGDVPANGLPTGLIGGVLGSAGATLVGRAAPTPVD